MIVYYYFFGRDILLLQLVYDNLMVENIRIILIGVECF